MTSEVADNTILSRVLAHGDTSAFDPSTDGLQPIRDRGDAEWITATGFSTHSATDVWTATEDVTGDTNTFKDIVVKPFRFFMNKMIITDANGNIALRNEADDGDIATGNVIDNSTLTTRAALTWP